MYSLSALSMQCCTITPHLLIGTALEFSYRLQRPFGHRAHSSRAEIVCIPVKGQTISHILHISNK